MNLPRELARHKWRRQLTIVAILLLAAWAFHAPILCGLARGLIAKDRPAPAPVVMLLDGDRQFELAARLQRTGTKTILVYRSRPDRLMRMGIIPREDDMARRELLKRGVPSQVLITLAGESNCRSQIAAALGTWLKEHPGQSVNVLCDRFTSRTWKLLFSRAAEPALAAKICVVAVPNRRYDETNWWRSKTGTLAFLQNSISLGYHCWRSGDEADVEERTTAEFRAAFAGDRR